MHVSSHLLLSFLLITGGFLPTTLGLLKPWKKHELLHWFKDFILHHHDHHHHNDPHHHSPHLLGLIHRILSHHHHHSCPDRREAPDYPQEVVPNREFVPNGEYQPEQLPVIHLHFPHTAPETQSILQNHNFGFNRYPPPKYTAPNPQTPNRFQASPTPKSEPHSNESSKDNLKFVEGESNVEASKDLDVRIDNKISKRSLDSPIFPIDETALANGTVAEYLISVLGEMDEGSFSEMMSSIKGEYLANHKEEGAEEAFTEIQEAVMELLRTDDGKKKKGGRQDRKVLVEEAAALLDLLAEEGEDPNDGLEPRAEDELYSDYYNDASEENKEDPSFLELLSLATKHRETKALASKA